ncbi:MAG: isocitrate lyase/phosphoenolpyruvate mutase family protein [Sulfitobacter sp.]
MSDQQEKAQDFGALHVKGTPLVLHNVWDAGSAKAVAEGGAKAIATGSWAVAEAQGYGDGQELPLADVLRTARQIVNAVKLPVSVDFEGGYGIAPKDVAENLRALIDTGIIGINFEDRIVRGSGLHTLSDQTARIAAMRSAAEAAGVALFVNARTDVFFQDDPAPHADLMAQAIERANAYADAGASGIFVPGLVDVELIARFCAEQPLPVNILRLDETLEIAALVNCGVARISHGPGPYIAAMQMLTKTVKGT